MGLNVGLIDDIQANLVAQFIPDPHQVVEWQSDQVMRMGVNTE